MEIINENFDCEVETEIWLLLWQMFPKLINGNRGVFVVRIVAHACSVKKENNTRVSQKII